MVDPQGRSTASFGAKFNTNYLKDGATLLVIPIPEDAAALIGKITATWGGIELRINGVIADLLKRFSKTEDNWEHRNFKKRNKLFRDLVREYGGEIGKDKVEPLLEASCAASEVQWQRNVIAHGVYNLKASEQPHGSVVIVAAGEYKGKSHELTIDVENLDKVYHEIAHIGGQLMATLLSLGVKLDYPEILIPDRDLLSDREHGSFHCLPTHGKA